MNLTRLYGVSAVFIWICGGLQQGAAYKLSIFGAQPDYLLILACLLGMLSDTRSALILGFAAGIVEGAIVGTNMWQFAVTRMLAAWIGSFLVESRFQRNFGTAAVVTVACTLICGLVYMILALQSNIGAVLKATIITAVYNGVLALLAYVPLERATGAKSQQL